MLSPILLSVITSTISAVIGALVGAIVSKIKTVQNENDKAERDAKESREMQRQTLKMTCRMAIYDDHFSTDEKLETYVIYRDTCHGNHQTKRYMDELVGCDVDEYLEKHRV